MYYKDHRFIFILPIALVVCLGAYQPTLTFLLEVAFLHFYVRCFNEKDFDIQREIKFYGMLLVAIFMGYAMYSLLIKVLLWVDGESGSIQRGKLWGNREFNNIVDFLTYGFDSFKWFISNGISEGINPAKSALVGHLSLRTPLIIFYNIVLILTNLSILIRSIYSHSRIKILLAIGVFPITVFIVILPIVVSGSGMIERVFYPFGLLLPAMFLVEFENKREARLQAISYLFGVILIVLMGSFQAQTFKGMANMAEFAQVEHRAMLNQLLTMPNYDLKDQVLIYPYLPNDRPVMDSSYWPLINQSPSINKYFKYYIGHEVNIMSLHDLKIDEMELIEGRIEALNIKPWPYHSSVFYMADLREGIYIIYYPYTLIDR